MNEIVFEKSNPVSGDKMVFRFRNPMYKRGSLYLEFKIPGIAEHEENDGFFFNASRFSEHEKAIRFDHKVMVDGKKLTGVSLDPENFQLIKTYADGLRDERNKQAQQIIDEIVSGDRLINFQIIGSEYPHYYPFINDLPEALNSASIFRQAMETYSEGIISSGDPHEILKRRLGFGIEVEEAFPETAQNLKFDPKEQEPYGFNEKVVTSFDMKLSDLIRIEWVKARKEKEKEAAAYKKSLDLTVLQQGKDGDDLWAKVQIKSPMTGMVMEFKCVNLFDVGFRIQKISSEENAEFEEQCREYIRKFSPIPTEIRL